MAEAARLGHCPQLRSPSRPSPSKALPRKTPAVCRQTERPGLPGHSYGTPPPSFPKPYTSRIPPRPDHCGNKQRIKIESRKYTEEEQNKNKRRKHTARLGCPAGESTTTLDYCRAVAAARRRRRRHRLFAPLCGKVSFSVLSRSFFDDCSPLSRFPAPPREGAASTEALGARPCLFCTRVDAEERGNRELFALCRQKDPVRVFFTVGMRPKGGARSPPLLFPQSVVWRCARFHGPSATLQHPGRL